MNKRLRWAGLAAIALLVAAGIAVAVLARSWDERASVSDLGWPVADPAGDAPDESGDAVRVTWLGISTLLFDDGETQILIDGTFTRLSIADLLGVRRVRSDVAAVNYALDRFRINRLAAIVPVHSHFDHAIDAGHVANRTTAVILGSESTANIARGANVPVDQYQTLASGESRHFGNFTVTLIETDHAPFGPLDEGFFPGVIDEPLEQPARVNAWRSGAVFSVFVSHPRGSTLVQGSAGFIPNLLADRQADVVMLGVGGLASLGSDYAHEYWRETVTATGAADVYAIHFEDFTLPFGDIRLFPDIADDMVSTAKWLDAAAGDGSVIKRLPFGVPITLY